MNTISALGKVAAQRVKQAVDDRVVYGGQALGALLGGGLGALGGGAHGLAFPGKDEEGKERSRSREALKRALMASIPGAVAGGWGGGALAGTGAEIVSNMINDGSLAAQVEKLRENQLGKSEWSEALRTGLPIV